MAAPTPSQPEEPVWLHPHVHEPNPAPPSADTKILLVRADGSHAAITVADLAALPQQSAPDCTIVSTGHGTSGPFHFEGVALADLLAANGVTEWRTADVISADGFGTRIHQRELIEAQQGNSAPIPVRPILLALVCDGKALTRREGLVRLIVPQERDDALRQVKWVARIEVR